MDPEAAFRCFERLHHVTITLHDPLGRFVRRLPATRFRHQHRLCQSAKAAGLERACIRFDGPLTRTTCLEHPQGFTKMCHAGLVELVVPHIEHGDVCWVLFAGPWRGAGDGTHELRAAESVVRLRGGERPPENLLDHLNALRWLAAHVAAAAPPPLPAANTRNDVIQHFLTHRHGEEIGLADLARELGVSPSRASHVVTEVTGTNFATALARTRLESAKLLLTHTGLSVSQVALRAGFGDLSHFHAVFRRAQHTTPAAWRRAHAEA